MFRRLRPRLSKVVFHASLSSPPTDRKLSDSQWADVAERFINEMGFGQSAYIAIKHNDTEHPHIHILASRVDAEARTVSDANDYQRAETIMRSIEKDYGLFAVAPSQAPTPQKPQQRRTTMDEITKKVIEDRLESASDIAEAQLHQMQGHAVTSVECSDELSDKELRNQRRNIIHSPEYEVTLRCVFSDEIKHFHRAGNTLVIYLKDESRLHDLGDRVVAYKMMSPDLAAKRLVKMAILKGWSRCTFNGSAEFLNAVFREAMAQGIVVIPNSPEQETILKTILGEGHDGGTVLAAAPNQTSTSLPAPSPRPTPALAPLPDLTRTLFPRQTPALPAPAPSAFGDEIARKLAKRREEQAQRLQPTKRGGGPTFR